MWTGMEGRSRVVGLYRVLLREGRKLTYTDRDYYRRIVRREFEMRRSLTDQEEIDNQFQV